MSSGRLMSCRAKAAVGLLLLLSIAIVATKESVGCDL